jgi:hypothetical protein
MTKPMLLALLAAALSGCVSASDREARCSCFTTDGSPTGNCDFASLPVGQGLTGGDAVFKFKAGPTVSTRGFTMRLTGEPCDA